MKAITNYHLNKLKAGATDADADCESKNVQDCGTDATATGYAFERIHIANKILTRRFPNRRTISNRLGSDQTFSNY